MASVSTTNSSSSAGPLGRNDDQQREFEESSDFANYFCTYGYLYHQKEMLEDQRRMDAYYRAVMSNKHHFEGKVVLDVGAGSGILSIWAAMAGAVRVYGVEATQMSKHAQTLVKANKLEGKVIMIQQKMEDLELPEKVDVIISEWMGYFLLRESMLDSVLVAKEKFLKPDGVLYPSHAWIEIAPITGDEVYKKAKQLEDSEDDWESFIHSTKEKFGVDMRALTPQYKKEQREYFLQTCQWAEIHRDAVIGRPVRVCELDLNTLKISDYTTVGKEFESKITHNGTVSGMGGWFGVEFRGSDTNPGTKPYVALDTHPAKGYTHWAQQTMHVNPPLPVQTGDLIRGAISIGRMKNSPRLLEIDLKMQKFTRNDPNNGKEKYESKYQLQ